MEPKVRLLELIKNSITFNSLPEEVRKMRMDMMLAADPETLGKYVEIMEKEAKETAALDASVENDFASIEELEDEVGQMETTIKKEEALEKENSQRKSDDDRADALLKELDALG